MLSLTTLQLLLLASLLPGGSLSLPVASDPITLNLSTRSHLTNITPEWSHSHAAALSSKYERLAEVYQRNTGHPHFGFNSVLGLGNSTSVVARDIASVSLTSVQNAMFYEGAIAIGSSGQPINVDFDTGSADLWIEGAGCGSSCQLDTKYDPSKSSNAVRIPSSDVSFGYVDGSSVKLESWKDEVSIGSLSANNQTVGYATSGSSGIYSNVLGMGWPGVVQQPGAIPFFETLVKQGQVQQPVFAFSLTESGGQLILGGIPSLNGRSITYISLTSNRPLGHWQLPMDSLIIGGKNLVNHPLSAIIDTGATGIAVDYKSAEAFYNNVPNAINLNQPQYGYAEGHYAIPCQGSPSISIGFSGHSFSMPSSGLALGPVDKVKTSDSTPYCLGGVIGYATGNVIDSDTIIVGNVFLRHFVSVFWYDESNPRVGFTPAA